MGKTHWIPPGRRAPRPQQTLFRTRCGRRIFGIEHTEHPTCLHCAPYARAHAMKVNADHGGHVELYEPTRNEDDWASPEAWFV